MNKQAGVTLFDLLAGMAIASVLMVFGIAIFGNNTIDCKDKDARPGYIMRAKIAAATADIGAVHIQLQRFVLNHNRLPDDISELKLPFDNDPWGNPYVFLNFKDVNGNGPKRKWRGDVPVNDYYDVYSLGPDGKTATPFTSIPGGDDIALANNGQYVGVACHYYVK